MDDQIRALLAKNAIRNWKRSSSSSDSDKYVPIRHKNPYKPAPKMYDPEDV